MPFNNFSGFNPSSRRARSANEDYGTAYDPGYYPQPLDEEGNPDAAVPPDEARLPKGSKRHGGGQHLGGDQDFTQKEVAGLKRAWSPVGAYAGGMGYSTQGSAGPEDWGNPQFFEKHSGKAAIDPLYLTELYRSWLPSTEPFFPKQFIKSGG